ncbi:uncharacterized protein ATNIH1004_005237 [Aspergillus tanneri]|uniref:Uncharacterized protein n=1 Tax=Aspergillus tanneri TaxID=1220188 RepID=A0A5M9MTQ9_9EURO|nr:uncharacterized protein ATNIH1004_005237 [Aspergillus tanneri]KAA8649336.1 hypothetical protein ATNIH1004_005237 [Aspergillus tanneri]
MFDGPSGGDRAEVKFNLKEGFGKDRVSISDLRNISLAVLLSSEDSIGIRCRRIGGPCLKEDSKFKFSDLNKWLSPPKHRWVKDSGEIVWKGELELEKWLYQDQEHY